MHMYGVSNWQMFSIKCAINKSYNLLLNINDGPTKFPSILCHMKMGTILAPVNCQLISRDFVCRGHPRLPLKYPTIFHNKVAH